MSVIFDNQMTASNGTSVPDITPAVGTALINVNSGFSVQDNRAYPTVDYATLSTNQSLPSEYLVRGVLRSLGEAGTNEIFQLFMQCNGTFGVQYYVLNIADGTWELQRATASTPSVVRSGSWSFSRNTDYTWEVALFGGDIKVYLDGAQQGTTYTDGSPLTGGTYACISCYQDGGTPYSAKGWHIDRLTLDDADPYATTGAAGTLINRGIITSLVNGGMVG